MAMATACFLDFTFGPCFDPECRVPCLNSCMVRSILVRFIPVAILSCGRRGEPVEQGGYDSGNRCEQGRVRGDRVLDLGGKYTTDCGQDQDQGRE